ncbi:hypothetical protein Bcsk_003790 [Bartonella sp. CDC_skunk]|uniref:hypothetical protein n=1 Tax=unclassified Bartonella TaxID=2645622 RepID=UPI0009C1B6FF|nr:MULTISPECIES: hypothetical protein [unclassified Bartonella]AQX21039.1 hypothetical protein Bcsk_003790 [Bartonella sp. CDC_skunk]AQX26297.1 hypothetical protein Bra60_002750 [Bartonella sp. Raccoon60]
MTLDETKTKKLTDIYPADIKTAHLVVKSIFRAWIRNICYKHGERRSLFFTKSKAVVVLSFKLKRIDTVAADNSFNVGLVTGLIKNMLLQKEFVWQLHVVL